MAKMMSKDSQIILNMLGIQDKMNAIIDKYDSVEELIEDKTSVDVLNYYIIKLFNLRKNFSGKTKKALSIFDDFKFGIVTKSLISCFPLVSDTQIVEFARSLCDVVAVDELKSRYDLCIKESENYNG